MFWQRDVLRFVGDEPRHWRVVLSDQRHVWLFDLDAPKTTFARWDRAELEGMLRARSVLVAGKDAYDKFHLESALTDNQRRYRDEMMEVIAPLTARVPEIFDDRIRGAAVAEMERRKIRSAKTLHQALHRFWRGGMSPDALVPGWAACGTFGDKDRSRKRGVQLKGDLKGVPVTTAIEKIFSRAISRHWINQRQTPLSLVYDMMKGEDFVDRIVDRNTGEISEVTKPEWLATGFPSLRQFRYWYSKHPERQKHRRARRGAAVYDKDDRARTGSALDGIKGVGARFEIDATELPVEIVDDDDPTKPIGSAVYYHVVDVFSGLIAGIHVGLETMSWTGASLAMRNVVEDKVKFARRFGVTIEPHEWPCKGVLPNGLAADNAEFKGKYATDFAAKSVIGIANARSLRGDDKGTVEGRFDMVKRELKLRLPGLRLKGHAEPDGMDESKKAKLTLRQLTAAMIYTVLLLNNRKLKDRVRTPAMIQAGVFAVPTDLWAWSVRTGDHQLKAFDDPMIELAMLPVAKGRFTGKGLEFKQMRYVGDDPRDVKFAEARQGKSRWADVSWDPLRTNHVFIHQSEEDRRVARREGRDPGPLFTRFSLTGNDKAYANLSFARAAARRKANEEDNRARQFSEAELRARVDDGIKGLIADANAASSGDMSNAQLRQRGANRKAALQRDQDARPSALQDAYDAAAGRNVTAPDELERRRAAMHERERRLAERNRNDEDDLNDEVTRALNEDPA